MASKKRFNYLYQSLYDGLRHLPLSWLYGLSRVIFWWVFYGLKYRRAEVADNLRRSLPAYTSAELARVEREFYRFLCDVAVESVKAGTLSESALRERVQVRNPEVLRAYTEQGQSVLLLAAHYGNWEWLLLGACLHLELPIDAVYKPLHNQQVDDWMLAIRSRFGAQPIPVNSAIMSIMQRRKETRAFALVADQSPIKEEEKCWTTFLGQDTPFPVGPQKIAQMTQYPALFVGMRRLKRGYYEIFFTPLGEPPYRKQPDYPLMHAYAHALEALIREQPAYWLWSYRKWKYKKSLYE